MSLTTTFPSGPYEAIFLPPARRGEVVIAPLTVTTDSGTIQFDDDPNPVATLYDGSGVVAVNTSNGAVILENSAVTDYDTAASTTIEARVLVDLDPPPAIDTYVLVMSAKIGTETVQASGILDVR